MVERDVEVWRLLTHARGKKELGPTKTKYPPEVDFPVSLSQAKSEAAPAAA